MSKPRAIISWSSGKDAAWALHIERLRGDVEIVAALTTVRDDDHESVPIHEVSRAIVEAQAEAIGLPLLAVQLPNEASNDIYVERLGAVLRGLGGDGITMMIFGDLFLSDVRTFRETFLASTGFSGRFPLWGTDTGRLAREMIDGGLRATVVAADTTQVPAAVTGQHFDRALLASLPTTADPCGERGEFHTLVHGGPMFTRPLDVIFDTATRIGHFAHATPHLRPRV